MEATLQRLRVLELAEELENIAEACRQGGMCLRSFYIWRQRYQTSGLEGLKRHYTTIHGRPNPITPEKKEAVRQMSLLHPTWGCDKLSAQLKLQGIKISSTPIQNILICNGMAKTADRRKLLEKKHREEGYPLTEEQLALIKKDGPDRSKGLKRHYKYQFIAPENKIAVINMSLTHPSWTRNKILAELEQQGIKMSSASIYRILAINKASKAADRRKLLEKMHLEEGYQLTEEQLALIKRYNPDFEPVY